MNERHFLPQRDSKDKDASLKIGKKKPLPLKKGGVSNQPFSW